MVGSRVDPAGVLTGMEPKNLYGPDPISHQLATEIRWLVGAFRARCEAASGDALDNQLHHCDALRGELYDILTGRERVYIDHPEGHQSRLLSDHGIRPAHDSTPLEQIAEGRGAAPPTGSPRLSLRSLPSNTRTPNTLKW